MDTIKSSTKLEHVNSDASSTEHVSSGRLHKWLMAVSLAAMSVLGGCDKPEAIEKCLGQEQANFHKDRLGTMEKTCKERVDDYVNMVDGEIRPTLRHDAQHACTRYSKELYALGLLLKAKKEAARTGKKWGKRDNCSAAQVDVQKDVDDLMNGDVKRLRED